MVGVVVKDIAIDAGGLQFHFRAGEIGQCLVVEVKL